MRKSIFVLAALFAATVANAQIILLHTFESWATMSTNPYADVYGNPLESPYLYEMNIPDGVAKLYNTEDFSLYKTIVTPVSGKNVCCYLVSRNILSTDNKVCFAISDESAESEIYIYNEDAQLIATIKGKTPYLVKTKGHYYLITHSFTYSEGVEKQTTYVYSVPGNGDSGEDIVAPSTPLKSSARKYLKNDQVLIESNDKTYTVQGQEVR